MIAAKLSPQKGWMFKDETFAKIWRDIEPYTMTSPERGYALYSAVKYLVANQIHGSFVECGVWRGGSSMIMLLTLKELGIGGRDIFLFDTFEGMTEPDERDLDCFGRPASELLSDENVNRSERELVRACASEEELRENIARCGYSPNRIRIVRGDVRETLSKVQTGPIALLRLDTDFYDSTYSEMEELYPRVQQEGVVLIDDYGHWQGSKKAVDDYFNRHAETVRQPLLQAVDYTGRIFVKQELPTCVDIQRYDYIPPGLEDPGLIRYFDSLEESDPTCVRWPYLRYRAPHIWRRDARSTSNIQIGVMSYEEALIVYNLAKQFAGRRALEIGCHFAWSTAHLCAAGLRLDVIDPALREQERVDAVTSSLARLGGQCEYRLWAGFSPSIVPAVWSVQGEPWSLALIDGNHDGDAPKLDAETVSNLCADDALVIFHDLASPYVANGLRTLKEKGWKTRIYNTMQIIGIAWRGNVKVLDHVADPNVPKAIFLPHLDGLHGE